MNKSMCVLNKDGKKGEERYELGCRYWDHKGLGVETWGGWWRAVSSLCVFVLISVFCATGDYPLCVPDQCWVPEPPLKTSF